MLAPAFIVSPGLLQKIYGARDDRAVRARRRRERARACSLYALVPVLLGMVARVLHPGARRTASSRCRCCSCTTCRLWVGALGLAAVFSAEVSAADAVLFMLATSLSQDLYKRFVNPAADRRAGADASRACAVGRRRHARRRRSRCVSPTRDRRARASSTRCSASACSCPIVAGLYCAARARSRRWRRSRAAWRRCWPCSCATGGRGVRHRLTPALAGLLRPRAAGAAFRPRRRIGAMMPRVREVET